jgi:uncharacterized protein (TIGR00369 family)
MDRDGASPRTRAFAWTDPTAIAERARRQGGLEFLRSIAGRDVAQAAPVAECLGFQLVEVEEGRVVFELAPAEWHYNPLGTVHGGVIATLCDSAAGAAVHSTLPMGCMYTTLEIKVAFLRALTSSRGGPDRVRCEGLVLARGRRVSTAEARLVDASGKLYAHATSTCLVLPLEEGR